MHSPRLRRLLLHRWFRQTSGQDLIEYAMLAAFISVAAYAGAASLGVSINGWYDAFGDSIANKSNCAAAGIAGSGGTCNAGSGNNAGGNGNGGGGNAGGNSGNGNGNGGGNGNGKNK